MSTQDLDRLKSLRQSIGQHMEDAACLFQQLPEHEHDYYLVNAIAAWELVATEPLSPEQLQRMIETLFSPDVDPEDQPLSPSQMDIGDVVRDGQILPRFCHHHCSLPLG